MGSVWQSRQLVEPAAMRVLDPLGGGRPVAARAGQRAARLVGPPVVLDGDVAHVARTAGHVRRRAVGDGEVGVVGHGGIDVRAVAVGAVGEVERGLTVGVVVGRAVEPADGAVVAVAAVAVGHGVHGRVGGVALHAAHVHGHVGVDLDPEAPRDRGRAAGGGHGERHRVDRVVSKLLGRRVGQRCRSWGSTWPRRRAVDLHLVGGQRQAVGVHDRRDGGLLDGDRGAVGGRHGADRWARPRP